MCHLFGIQYYHRRFFKDKTIKPLQIIIGWFLAIFLFRAKKSHEIYNALNAVYSNIDQEHNQTINVEYSNISIYSPYFIWFEIILMKEDLFRPYSQFGGISYFVELS